MKKLALALVLVMLFGMACYDDTHYTRKDCEIVDVENGVVTFKDIVGHYWKWEIEPNEYFEKGDFVDLKMFNNYTDNNINDDEIKEIVFHD